MPNKCVWRGCLSGRTVTGIPMFKCTDETQLAKWQAVVPRNRFPLPAPLNMASTVCAKHFREEDVLTHDVTTLPDGTQVRRARLRPSLVRGSVPVPDPVPVAQAVPASPVTPSRPAGLGPIASTPVRPGGTSSPGGSPMDVTLSSLSSDTDKENVSMRSVYSYGTPLTPRNLNVSAFKHPQTTPRQRFPVPIRQKNLDQDLQDTSAIDLPPNTPESKVLFHLVHNSPNSIKLPGKFWGVHSDNEKKTVFAVIDSVVRLEKTVIFTETMTPTIIFGETTLDLVRECRSKFDVERLLKQVHSMRACIGITDLTYKKRVWSSKCSGHVPTTSSPGRIKFRCDRCIAGRRAQQKVVHKQTAEEKLQRARAKVKVEKQKSRRYAKRIQILEAQVNALMHRVTRMKAEAKAELLKSLPLQQQVLVQACIDAAKHYNSKNRRYTTEWIYECLLMRLKAPGLYEKLRTENKIALPSKRTLQRYMSALRPAFGFQENVFNMMAMKAEHLSKAERHGCLLLDEMALEKRVYFDKNDCTVHGLAEGDKHGDHALVIMFQPFRGKWVQALGAFISAGAVTSGNLHKLILEATGLLNKAGYVVDCVSTDAATWNRSMWDLFGINAENPSCEHPLDSNRRLRFASDFPHLIKNLWTRILESKILNVPEGTVQLSHWWAVLHQEENKGIKAAFTLTRDHLDPTHYQKMKVRLAMQFFGGRMADAMEHYMRMGVAGLENAAPTIAFIRRINRVVDAMNSQVPWEALKPDKDSTHHKTLTDFLTYLDEMNAAAKVKYDESVRQKMREGKRRPRAKRPGTPYVGFPDEMTASVWLGLVVTIKNTLCLINYLHQEANFAYLMTRRLNQDSLEHFFGHIRGACGANSHPDPKMFIYIYRLLMTYSLIKPPRGSNVSGGEVMDALLELKDLEGQENQERRAELERKIDELLDSDLDELEGESADQLASIDPYSLTVFGGYVARKMRAVLPAKECPECTECLCKEAGSTWEDRESLLALRSRGGLLRPSQQLFDLLTKLEQAVVTVTCNIKVHESLLFTVLDELLSSSWNFQCIGCEEHQRGLTTCIISFYLTTRMHFVCAETNRENADKNRQKRAMAKTARL